MKDCSPSCSRPPLVAPSQSEPRLLHPQVLKIRIAVKTPSPVRITRDKEQPSKGRILVTRVRKLNKVVSPPREVHREVTLNLGFINLLARRKLLAKKN